MLSKLTKNLKSKVGGSKANVAANCKKDHFKLALKTGNIVQLFSRMTGNTLQVNTNNVLDALGAKEIDASNTLWTVIVEDENTIQLHQEDLFLSIVDGETTLTKKDESTEDNTKLKINFQEQFVLFEAANGCGHHIGMLENGLLKTAIATGTEHNSHFAVKIVFSIAAESNEKKEEETGDELEGEKEKVDENTNENKDEAVVENGDTSASPYSDANEIETHDIVIKPENDKCENDIKEEKAPETVEEEPKKDVSVENAEATN